MKKFKRNIIIVLTSVLAIVLLIYCVFHHYIIYIYFSPPSQAALDKQKRMLIYETNHNELLSACRQLMKEVGEGIWQNDEQVIVKGNIVVKPHPDAKNLPEIILKLKPRYLVINNEHVCIEFAGGFTHYGFYAYSKNYPKDKYYYGNKKLIVDDMWYYDDDYSRDPNFGEYIESLRPKSQTTGEARPED